MANSTSLRGDLQLGGVWTNITGQIYTKEEIKIRRGRADEAAIAEASSCDLTLNNRTGNFTPGNPTGAYFGQLNRSTPIRIGMGVPPMGTGVTYTSNVTTVANSPVVAEQSGILFSLWAAHTTTGTLSSATGYTMSAQQTGTFATSIAGYKAVSAGTVGGDSITNTVSTTASAVSVVLPGATTVAAVQQNVGAGAFGTGSGSPFATAITFTPVALNAGDVLLVLSAWSGDIGGNMACAPQDNAVANQWTMIADSTFTASNIVPRAQAWAFYSTRAQTVTVTVPNHYYYNDDLFATMFVVNGTAQWNPRYSGECATFSSTVDLSGADVRATVTCGSVLRRRGQGLQEPNSAFQRFLSKSRALGYWPFEGAVSQAIISPLQRSSAVPLANTYGAVTFNNQAVQGSNSLPTITAGGVGYVVCPMPAYVPASANVAGSMMCVMQLSASPTGTPVFLGANVAGSGAIGATEVGLRWNSLSAFDVVVTKNGTTNTLGTSFGIALPPNVSTWIGRPVFVLVTWAPNVSNPTTQSDIGVLVLDMLTGFPLVNSSVVGGGQTFGQVTALTFGVDASGGTLAGANCAFGHLAFTPTGKNDNATLAANAILETGPAYVGLAQAWNGEDVITRMTRVAQEEFILFHSRPPSKTPNANIPLGYQEPNGGVDILLEAQQTDDGEIFEARGYAGLTYMSLGEMSGQASMLTLNYAGRQISDPFEQVDDDQLTRNDVTISQQGGPSARAVLTSGTLSVNPPPNGVGVYTSGLTVNVAQQGRDLIQVASWELSLGTTNAIRYKALNSKLTANTSTIDAVSALDVAQRFTVTNPPSWAPPGPIEMIALGLDETISDVPASEWTVSINARPYAPFAALVLASTNTQPNQQATIDSSSSTLTSNVNATATSISVTTALMTDLWTTTNVPFDVTLSGERMTVTAVSGSSSPQTFTVTRSVNGVSKAQTAGTPVNVYYQSRVGLAGL